jgi:dihydrofolate reductase
VTRVILDVSPSLDGFLAGVDVSVDAPFGSAGHRLHRWLGFDGGVPDARDEAAAAAMLAGAGAVVIGRRMFDVGIAHWGDDGAWRMPCFVVTHRPRPALVRGATVFTFVTEGVHEAVRQARAAAGDEDVVVAGGAGIAQQCLAADLVDELRLHVVPVLLGRGTRLFADSLRFQETRLTGLVATPNAIHQTYVLVRAR